MNRFLEKVGAWLVQKGNTKQILANQLDMSTVTLNKKLDGDVRWTWDEVCSLADILGCELEDFR